MSREAEGRGGEEEDDEEREEGGVEVAFSRLCQHCLHISVPFIKFFLT